MAYTCKKGVLCFLLLLNLLMYATMFVLAFSFWFINKIIDRNKHQYLKDSMAIDNSIIFFSLISGAIGMFSVVAGMAHLRTWCDNSLAVAINTGFISSNMMFVAFGFTCAHMSRGNRGVLTRALESFIIIVTVTDFLYLMMLDLSFNNSNNDADNDDETMKDSTAAAVRPDVV